MFCILFALAGAVIGAAGALAVHDASAPSPLTLAERRHALDSITYP
jgi:hypothetical protein